MIPSPGDLVERVLEHLLQPHVHDVRKNPPLGIARPLARCAGQLEDVAFRDQGLECRPEPFLEPLGIVLGVAVLVLAWVLTAAYVVWANRNYDPEVQRLRDRLGK